MKRPSPRSTRVSSGSAVRKVSFCTAGNIAAHQPEDRIWSVVRKDDTRRPSVGKIHRSTSAATEM
jgi:hypothetical protein